MYGLLKNDDFPCKADGGDRVVEIAAVAGSGPLIGLEAGFRSRDRGYKYRSMSALVTCSFCVGACTSGAPGH